MSNLDSLNDALRDLYYPPMVQQLNDTALLLSRLGDTVEYPPVSRRVRVWRSMKWKVYSSRRWLGYRIAGYNPDHWLDD